MSEPRYAAGLICLNEERHIQKWLEVHYDFYDVIAICEGADAHFPRDAVTPQGLSTDRTAEIILSFPDPDDKIKFIQHGWAPLGGCEKIGEGEGKCILRDRCAQYLNEIKFDGIYIHADADEFVPREVQPQLKKWVADVTEKWRAPRTEKAYLTDEGYVAEAELSPETIRAILGSGVKDPVLETHYPAGRIHAFQFPTVHLWHDTKHLIVGGYFDIEHTRVFRWQIGSRYEYNGRKSHNWPTAPSGKPLLKHGSHSETRSFDMVPVDGVSVVTKPEELRGVNHTSKPYILHYGFTRSESEMRERLDYYKARGEEVSRPDTVADRESWFDDEVRKARDLHVFDWCGPDPMEESNA